MRITITKLTFISVVLTLSLFICAPLATADDTDEQAQYDKAMDLISNWQGRDKNRGRGPENRLENAQGQSKQRPGVHRIGARHVVDGIYQ